MEKNRPTCGLTCNNSKKFPETASLHTCSTVVLNSNRKHHGLRYRHRFHQLAVLPGILKIQRNQKLAATVTVGGKGFECDHTVRVAATGKRVQQHGSHPAENCCVGADSKNASVRTAIAVTPREFCGTCAGRNGSPGAGSRGMGGRLALDNFPWFSPERRVRGNVSRAWGANGPPPSPRCMAVAVQLIAPAGCAAVLLKQPAQPRQPRT